MHRSRARPRPRSSARARALAGCALVLAVLGTAPAPPVPAPAPRGSPDPLAAFHSQRPTWGECPGSRVPEGMRCATLTVPLDHADPAKGTTRIALSRIPATAPARGRLGPLLLNFGGPGAPGIASLAEDPATFAKLGERYDLVAFDPRGVGLSDPVSCGGSDRPADVGGARDAVAELAALRATAARCTRYSGPVLAYIGTVQASRDMDVIRRVLGADKLDYLGFSYGTRLGAAYAAQFPKSTGRMVLDGVDTLTEPLVEQALASARGQQRALDHFLAWCARRTGCVYGTNTRTAKEDVAALVERLDREPVTGEDGSAFTGQDAVAAVGAALYSKDSWPDLADALTRLEEHDDPVGLMQLGGPTGSPPGDDGTDSGIPADNAEAALTAVNCADDPDRGAPTASPAQLLRELTGLEAEFRQASRIFGPQQLGTVLACYGRPAGSDFIRRIDHPGAPRMLLVGTRGDPATPYEWTEETAARLGSAVVLDHKGDGHTGYGTSACVREYVDGFLVDGRLPHGTRSCPAGE
ncbi:alpha/beta hydrolase [Streptomyces sp. NBC_00249]|uniref:alpha/beta hydrolase n=1 Tax=Streptomyces sp. NBC_00249 TaxID=2975690 RepID=UPI002252BC06|nr:alpha/beta hydrolase [Streptomyces sp. NBC_00249]MCX5199061.1 alpha/beta hydrolase [Streptomyces sp. NBC_00249]